MGQPDWMRFQKPRSRMNRRRMRTTTQSSLALDACGKPPTIRMRSITTSAALAALAHCGLGLHVAGFGTQQISCSNGTAWNCVVPGNVWFRLVLNVPGHIHGRRCCRAWTAHVSGAHQPADLVEDSRATWPSPWLIAY
jgi:hypothetical protein